MDTASHIDQTCSSRTPSPAVPMAGQGNKCRQSQIERHTRRRLKEMKVDRTCRCGCRTKGGSKELVRCRPVKSNERMKARGKKERKDSREPRCGWAKIAEETQRKGLRSEEGRQEIQVASAQTKNRERPNRKARCVKERRTNTRKRD